MKQVAATRAVIVPAAQDWPFVHPLVPRLPSGPVAIRVEGIHEAFVNHQTANTRLVTTNAAYVMQEWAHALEGRADVALTATADEDLLARYGPELFDRGSPRSPRNGLPISFEWVKAAGEQKPHLGPLPRAMRAEDPETRLALCIDALNHGRTAPALLAAASTCMEVNDLESAARDLEAAIGLAPDWAAAHFEQGKLWLRRDDMARAGEAFRRATTLLPGFTSAWANLGATLGELDRPEEALAAFETALGQDPLNAQALNNVGVVRRELGRLDASEAAFRRVVELEPDRAFGYYNLGHTLFLAGRFHEALSAYVEGQRRDPARNPVQATRLALCRLATGDPRGALEDLQAAAAPLPRDYRRQLLADTQAIAWALLTHRPDLPGWRDVIDWLTTELSHA